MRLSYDPDDPYTISMRLPGNDSVWLLSREMILDGLHRCVGHGDVRMWPSAIDNADIMLAISSHDGHALFAVKRTILTDFLARTLIRVPRGTESDHMNVDVMISEIMKSTHIE